MIVQTVPTNLSTTGSLLARLVRAPGRPRRVNALQDYIMYKCHRRELSNGADRVGMNHEWYNRQVNINEVVVVKSSKRSEKNMRKHHSTTPCGVHLRDLAFGGVSGLLDIPVP